MTLTSAPALHVVRSKRDLRELALAGAPALVSGPRCRGNQHPRGPVLVCLDGSERGDGCLDASEALATAERAEVVLVAVAPRRPPACAAPYFNAHDLVEGAHLARASARFAGLGVETRWDVLHGEPSRALLQYASQLDAEVIALTSNGRSRRRAVERLPMWMVFHSPVPVLLTFQREPPPPAVAPRGRVVSQADWPALIRAALRMWLLRCFIAVAVLGSSVIVAANATDYSRPSGWTLPATSVIAAQGGEAPSGGAFLLTLVDEHRLSTREVVTAWLTSDADVRSATELDPATAAVAQQVMTASLEAARAAASAESGREIPPPEFDLHGLGGPSAGLAFALELVDANTPGDLTRGRVVAATGAIAADGTVTAIGGAKFKAAAAASAGADLILVPSANLIEAQEGAPGSKIAAVDSLRDALAVLQATAPSRTGR